MSTTNFTLKPEFKKLAETDCLILGHIYEDTFLIDKISGVDIYLDSFYGDPCFGLIDVKSNWCIVGSDHVVIWYTDRPLVQVDRNLIERVIAARQVSQHDVELIAEAADGWFDKKRLNVNTLLVNHLATIHKTDYYLDEVQEWVW